MVPRGTLWFRFFDRCSISCSSFPISIPLTFISYLACFSGKAIVSEIIADTAISEQLSNMDFGDGGTVLVWIFSVHQPRGKLVKINGMIYVKVY